MREGKGRRGTATAACVSLLLAGACSAGDSRPDALGGASGFNGTGGSSGSGPIEDGGIILPDSGAAGGPNQYADDPSTCAEAAANRSYVGCDYWPTVTANAVWQVFDFAVIVSNTGKEKAEVHVTGPNGVDETREVVPGALEVIYLPWVPELKGGQADECGSSPAMSASVLKIGGAYHLVSTRPVTVYQFNALEYKGQGGPPGKDWSSCLGNDICYDIGRSVGCFSFSNDASLLLPSTAMTGNYRLVGANAVNAMPTYVTITATQDNTEVELRSAGTTIAGGGIAALAPGQSGTFVLNKGDVAQVLSRDDLSGSLVFANKPVQVITGMPCRTMPEDKPACDHIEESVFPAETIGKEYVVTVPSSPEDPATPVVGHGVRIVGNSDDTHLSFDPPISGPGVVNGQVVIQAGQVLDLGAQGVDFKVSGDKEFMVASFMFGGSLVDPSTGLDPDSKGDPSQSLATATEQFRKKYVFLAPADYDVNMVNIVGPSNANVTLDGYVIPPEWYRPIGNSGLGVVRFKLDNAKPVHTLESERPVGIQVYGYGSYTSYQYPGGLNLKPIAAPPPR